MLAQVKNGPLINMFDGWFVFFVRMNVDFTCLDFLLYSLLRSAV